VCQEGRESAEIGYLFQVGAVGVDQKQFKLAPVAIVAIRRKQDLFSVRREGGSETGAAEVGDFVHAVTLPVGNEQFHLHGRGQVLRQQHLISAEVLRVHRMIRAPHQLLAVARVHRPAVVTVRLGDLPLVGAVRIHGPKLQIARLHGRVHDLAGLPIHRAFGIVAGRARQFLRYFPVVGRKIDVVRRIDRPHVTLAAIHFLGTRVARFVRRCKDDVLVIGQEVSAGGASLSGGDHVRIGAVRIHNEDLVALQVVSRGLKDQPLAVRRPIGLGVLPPEGQLLDIVEMRRRLREQPSGDENEKDVASQTSIVAQSAINLKWHNQPGPAKLPW
jgi:hypothetical protein